VSCERRLQSTNGWTFLQRSCAPAVDEGKLLGTHRVDELVRRSVIIVENVITQTPKGTTVVRTQIQLTEHQTREVKHWADERGVSMAAIIREAIDEHLHHRNRPPREEIIARAIAAAGSAHSGSGDVSVRHDEYFADSAAGAESKSTDAASKPTDAASELGDVPDEHSEQ
jgi:hypothetical protein